MSHPWEIRLPAVVRPPPGAWVQERIEPVDGARVVLAPPAYVTNPGRKIGYGDQFLVKPGEIRQVLQPQHACPAFQAKDVGFGGLVFTFGHVGLTGQFASGRR
jgi:hypothetical protein